MTCGSWGYHKPIFLKFSMMMMVIMMMMMVMMVMMMTMMMMSMMMMSMTSMMSMMMMMTTMMMTVTCSLGRLLALRLDFDNLGLFGLRLFRLGRLYPDFTGRGGRRLGGPATK